MFLGTKHELLFLDRRRRAGCLDPLDSQGTVSLYRSVDLPVGRLDLLIDAIGPSHRSFGDWTFVSVVWTFLAK